MNIMRKFFIAGIIALLLFIFFSYLVHKNLFVHLDFNTTVRLQDHLSRGFISLFSFFSDIGKVEIVSIFLLIVLGLYAIRFKKWLAFIWTFLAFGALHLVEIYGKTFVHHLPPPHFMLLTKDVFTFPEFYVQATNSYPSGHAGRALFTTVVLAVLTGKSQKPKSKQKWFVYGFLVLYDMIMLTSRIYLGEHWLSDVIGGSFLGLAVGFLGSIFI